LILDKSYVEGSKSLPDPQGNSGTDKSDRQQAATERRHTDQQHELHDSGSSCFARAIAHHVENGLRSVPHPRVHRDKEQLVAAAEERIVQDRLEAAKRGDDRPRRKHQRHEPEAADCAWQRVDRSAHPELAYDALRVRLGQEGKHLHGSVKHREEPQQLRTRAERCPRLRFQQEVDNRRTGAGEDHEHGNRSKVRRPKDLAETGRARFRRPVIASEQPRGALHHRHPARTQ